MDFITRERSSRASHFFFPPSEVSVVEPGNRETGDWEEKKSSSLTYILRYVFKWANSITILLRKTSSFRASPCDLLIKFKITTLCFLEKFEKNSFADDSVKDLLKVCQIHELPAGTAKVPVGGGRCPGPTGEEFVPFAYKLDETAQLSVSTGQVFPDGFPHDFSILLAARPSPGKVAASLFTIYNEEGEEQLSVALGSDVSIYYEDTDGLPEEENLISFGTNIDDGL